MWNLNKLIVIADFTFSKFKILIIIINHSNFVSSATLIKTAKIKITINTRRIAFFSTSQSFELI